MLDLEPPKPTKEFHDAYLEIYGKGKKKTENKEQLSFQEPISFNIPSFAKKNGSDDLVSLDLPPPKEKESKKGFLSGLFAKKKEKEEEKQKEFSSLAKLDLPPLRREEHKELIDGEPVDVTSFSKEEQGAMNELEKLDLPPLKAVSSWGVSSVDRAKILPQFPLDIEPPITSPINKKSQPEQSPGVFFNPRNENLQRVPSFETKEKPKPIHDFLAEIKFGAKKKLPEQKEEKEQKQFGQKEISHNEFNIPKPSWISKPISSNKNEFQVESAFEKEKAAMGARDLGVAYEKTHPFETGGFEYLEPIQTLPKNTPASFSKEHLEMPQKTAIKASEFKSAAECKKYMALLKQYEQEAKKQAAIHKKKQQEVQLLIKKQAAEEKKLDEKMHKMQLMQKELEQKQHDVLQYEPKMQALWKKEDEMSAKEASTKQKLQEAQETEIRIRTEEDAIVAKIKKLEADQKRLEKEEDAVTKTVARLDKDRAVITAKTREFANIIKEIGNAEKELKEKSEMMDDREARIKRKEKIIETEFARIQKLKKTAENLKDVEETYARVKERLRIAYKEYEEKFSNQKAYAPQEIHAVPIQPTFQPLRSMQEAKVADSGDITNLITATKQLIIDKHYEDANKNINRLMQKHMQIPDNNPRKKEIYYEIVGLKNMLKLDLLE